MLVLSPEVGRLLPRTIRFYRIGQVGDESVNLYSYRFLILKIYINFADNIILDFVVTTNLSLSKVHFITYVKTKRRELKHQAVGYQRQESS